jgi:hypothetical protein
LEMNKRIVVQIVVIALVILFISGCSSVKFIPLDSATYPPTDSVKVYWEKPNVPYKEFGVITAESSEGGEEKLLNMVKEKAMAVGAQGIIVRPPNQRTRTVIIPPSAGGPSMTPTTITYQLGALAIRFKEQSASPEIKPPTPKADLTTQPQEISPKEPIKSSSPTSISEKNKISVTGTFANIRSGAGNEFSIITIVKQGDTLILLGEYGEWYHVRTGTGQEGWINNRFVK